MAQPISPPVSPVFLPLQILLIGIDLLVSLYEIKRREEMHD